MVCFRIIIVILNEMYTVWKDQLKSHKIVRVMRFLEKLYIIR